MKLIHLSDLHFGTELDSVVADLESSIKALSPDMVIISGDFTQSATTKEFKTSRAFLDALPCDYLCVPGNHDIPGFDLIERLTKPYEKYKNYIDQDLCPTYQKGNINIIGLNSARRFVPHWNWANGALSAAQMDILKSRVSQDEKSWNICTFHHPIHKVDEMPLDVIVFGAKYALQAIQDLKVDLVLTGHVHHASITTRGDQDHQTVYLSASTALSSRLREQENGFNVIEFTDKTMTITLYKHDGKGFASYETFTRDKNI